MRLSRDAEETTFSFSKEVPAPVERRKQVRHLTILRVGVLVAEGKRELCLIRNISAGGLMAHIYSSLEVGQPVAIELKSNHQLTGTVTWEKDSNVGVTFDTPIDVEEMLANHALPESGWRPRMPRVELDRLAELRVGARVHAVSTCNISQGGVQIEADEPLEVGSEVVLTMQKFQPLKGVIRWFRNGRGGIAFNQVIPFNALMAWLRS